MGRIDKINHQVKREISRIIQQELSDPRLQFVTITDVDVSKDLRHARIHYSVLGDQGQMAAAQSGLKAAKGMIRKLLGERIQLRYTPDLIFLYDQSVEMNVRIEETLKEIHDEHEHRDPDHQEE